MQKRVIISTVLASLLFSTSALYANMSDSVASKETKAINNPSSVKHHASAKAKVEETASKESFQAKLDRTKFITEANQEKANRLQKVMTKIAMKHQQSLKKAPKEMLEALQQTVTALRALQQDKVVEAKKALQKATKLFDASLKDNPKLDFIPVANDIHINDFEGNSKMVQDVIDTAQKLLKDHDTQAARDMLMPLQDEMEMTTVFLPLATYPDVTKEALKELNKGHKKLAFTRLATGLNSTVVETTIVPLPLITAQDLVLLASSLDKDKKKEAKKLLNEAQDELQKAVLLGYTKKQTQEYKNLHNEINKIQKEIQGKNKVEKLYTHLIKIVDSLLHKHQNETTKKATSAK